MCADRDVLSDRCVSVAIGPCGCGYGIECENGETGQATVARWKFEGATIERLPIDEAKDRVVLDCPHEPRYGLLPLSEARAEALRLRAENEALREDMLRFRTAAQVNTPGSLQKFVLDITARRLGLAPSSDEQGDTK